MDWGLCGFRTVGFIGLSVYCIGLRASGSKYRLRPLGFHALTLGTIVAWTP